MGISFAVHRETIVETDAVRFSNHPQEDFLFVQKVQQQHKCHVSKQVAYFVRPGGCYVWPGGLMVMCPWLGGMVQLTHVVASAVVELS